MQPVWFTLLDVEDAPFECEVCGKTISSKKLCTFTIVWHLKTKEYASANATEKMPIKLKTII